jgi:ABC-2 type transport system permease protein
MTELRTASRLGTARLGLARGAIELRQTLTYWPDLVGYYVVAGIEIAVLLLMRGHHVPGTSFSLGSQSLPSVIGMGVGFSGLLGVTGLLATEREDGTLLRARAIPGGMTGYVLGKITLAAGTALVGVASTVVVGLIVFPGVRLSGPGAATLIGVTLLGLLATIPLGIMAGSLLPNPRMFALAMLPFSAITAVSGIFYPITHLPGWLQGVGQVFPLYWLGLGMRCALLPPQLAAAEIGQSWRLPLVFGVLALWSLFGLAAAPGLLRRMARRESGSRVAERHERAMLRGR